MLRRSGFEQLGRTFWLACPLLVGVAVAVGVSWWALSSGSHIDTAVFRDAGQALLRRQSPYHLSAEVPFVYPPAGALVILPTALAANFHGATLLWIAISVVALGRTTWILVHLAWPRLGAARRLRHTCWLFAVGCLLEPTLITLSFGQVGLVLLWLTVEGLRGQPRHTTRPWLVGVAAAAKLTAGVVLVGLAAAGRWRSAVWAVVGFVGACAAAAAISPAAVSDYVGGAWRLAEDVNSTPNVLNHSLVGVAALLVLPGWIGLSAAAVALVLGIGITAALWRQGDELAGLATVLVTGLLVSPVSWPHHWVAIYPSLVLLLREARTRRVGAIVLLSTAITGMLLWVDQVGLPGSPVRVSGEAWWLPQREWYVIWGVVFLVWAWQSLVLGRAEKPPRRSGATTGSKIHDA